MYLLEYQCLNCGTKFYAEEKEGNLIYCPFCSREEIWKTENEVKAEIFKKE